MPPPALLRVNEPLEYMLQCSLVTKGWLLCFNPFGHKIHQGLGLDCCLGHIG
jgi:hypothetical protein